MNAGVSVDGLGWPLLSRGVIAGSGMFLALNSSLSKGSADSRNRKSATNNTATHGSCWLTPPAPLPTVVVCCQEQTHNRRRERECVFVWIQDARSAGRAEIQQMWPLFILLLNECKISTEGVLVAWTRAPPERMSWS